MNAPGATRQAPPSTGPWSPTELGRDYRFCAREYLEAARLAIRGLTSTVDVVALHRPLNFLLGQACELVLKSLLADRGWTERKLISKAGHDLDAAIDACIEAKAPLTADFVEYCRFASEAHKRHWFRYAGSAAFMGFDYALRAIEQQLDQAG